MGAHHPIAMAAGIMPEADPVQLVEAAASAGYDYGGMWMEPEIWTDRTTADVAAALRRTGLKLNDIEVVWIRPGAPNPDHLRIVETGAELGARNVLCVSSDPDPGATRDKLTILAERGAALGVRVNLEFGLFTEVKTIHAARAILEGVPSPAKGLLIDALHWSRSGGTLADIEAIPRDWLSYAQLCDAPAQAPDPNDIQAIITDAVDGRLPTGEGVLPLGEIVRRLPDGLIVTIEERSKRLRETWPNLNERAARVLKTTRAFFDRLQEKASPS